MHLIIFGLHSIARWRSRENCVVAAVRSEIVVGGVVGGARSRKLSQRISTHPHGGKCVVAVVRSEIVVGDRCRGPKVAQIASENINGPHVAEVSFRCSGT